MKKLLVLMILFSSGAFAQCCWVAKTGSDSGGNGTETSPWQTIGRAVSGVSTGETITVLAGTYSERIQISTPGITLMARPGDEVVVDGQGLVFGEFRGLIESSSGVSDLTFDGLRVTNSPGYAMKIFRGSRVTVKNCEVDRSWNGGIIFEGPATDATVIDNHVHNTSLKGFSAAHEAITLSRINGFEIARNLSHDNGEEGIDAKIDSRNGTIHDNIVYNNGRVGLYVDSVAEVEIFGNVVYNNATQGITIGVEFSPRTDRVQVHHNVMYGNGDGGLAFFLDSSEFEDDFVIVGAFKLFLDRDKFCF